MINAVAVNNKGEYARLSTVMGFVTDRVAVRWVEDINHATVSTPLYFSREFKKLGITDYNLHPAEVQVILQ